MKRIKALTNWKKERKRKERKTNALQTDTLQTEILQKNAFQTEAKGISMSSRAFIFFILLFLFNLSNLLSAELISPENLPTGCEVATKLDFGNQTGPTSAEQNWKSLSFIGLLLSAALVSIIYMIGKAMDAPGLMARAKTDLIQVAVTGIALVLLYGILSGLCAIDAREFGFGFSSFFDGANKYFEYCRQLALKTYLDSANSIMVISAFSSFSVNTPEFLRFGNYFSIGIFLKPYAGYGLMIGAINWFASLVLLSYSLVTGFMVVLNAIQVYFLNLLLPAGIVLRCFSPTRDFGGVLIAISIGMFVFYPLLFSFSYMITAIAENQAELTPPSLPDMDWYPQVRAAVATALVYSVIPFANVVVLLRALSSSGNIAITALLNAYGEVGQTILPIYILPAINWIILAAIVRELSKVLGQEVDISGLARMI
jgi:hypothetical protein